MKKITYLSIIFCLTFLGLMSPAFFARTAQAVVPPPPSLAVTFTPNPLFGAVNFLPSQSVSGLVTVTNNSGATKTVITEAINVRDPQHFGDVLDFEIKEGATSIYGASSTKTLTDFFGAGELNLTSLANGATTVYEYVVTFQPSANDDYQGKKLDNFDILVGFRGEDGGEDTVVVSGTSNGGGGGGYQGLTIYNEATIDVHDTYATITWFTNYNSTSRVVYGAASEAHIFDLSATPNYGYANGTTEDSNMVTFHSVFVSPLTPGTTYYYRVISHASPDTVGQEFSFTTMVPAPAEETGGGTVAGEETGPSAGSGQAGGNIAAGGASATGNVVAGAETTSEGSEIPAEMVLGAKSECPACAWWQWLIIALLLIGVNFMYYLVFRKEKENN